MPIPWLHLRFNLLRIYSINWYVKGVSIRSRERVQLYSLGYGNLGLGTVFDGNKGQLSIFCSMEWDKMWYNLGV